MPKMVTIRQAQSVDAASVSDVICRTLTTTNAQDYSPTVIERVLENFTPDIVSELLTKRTVFVACIGEQVIGTASLEGSYVRTVFVLPKTQGMGVGKMLMEAVERAAIARGISEIFVPSSVTAREFYTHLGYGHVEGHWFGDEQTFLMQKDLTK